MLIGILIDFAFVFCLLRLGASWTIVIVAGLWSLIGQLYLHGKYK